MFRPTLELLEARCAPAAVLPSGAIDPTVLNSAAVVRVLQAPAPEPATLAVPVAPVQVYPNTTLPPGQVQTEAAVAADDVWLESPVYAHQLWFVEAEWGEGTLEAEEVDVEEVPEPIE